MDDEAYRKAYMDALLDCAKRTGDWEFRKLMAWLRRVTRHGGFPSWLVIADVLELQLHVIRRGRCPVPCCDRRTSIAKPARPRKGVAPSEDPENRYRLCRAHRSLRDAGLLRVSGSPESPSFFTCDGQPITYGPLTTSNPPPTEPR